MSADRSTPARLDHQGDTLLNTREAADLLSERLIRVTEGTLNMSRVRRRLLGREAPPWVRIGRAVRYRRRDLDQWLANAIEEHHPSQKRA